jgi:hypothetical protein
VANLGRGVDYRSHLTHCVVPRSSLGRWADRCASFWDNHQRYTSMSSRNRLCASSQLSYDRSNYFGTVSWSHGGKRADFDQAEMTCSPPVVDAQIRCSLRIGARIPFQALGLTARLQVNSEEAAGRPGVWCRDGSKARFIHEQRELAMPSSL